MSISASMVKELRERTGAGMMECKRALVESNGDMEAAIEAMRISGLAKADKKAGRVAAEGIIAAIAADNGRAAVLVEVNCETDFVAKGDDFVGFANAVAQIALDNRCSDVETLMQATGAGLDGQSVEDARQALVGRIGENIQVRRLAAQYVEEGAQVGLYLHGSRIGVITNIENGTAEIAKDVAMHVAASRPVCVSEKNVPAELLEKERAILTAEARESGKPEEIIGKMVEGRVRKYLAEITLTGQAFVKDPDQTVGKLLSSANATAIAFDRIEVGEGIEKKETDFVAEVMAQAGQS